MRAEQGDQKEKAQDSRIPTVLYWFCVQSSLRGRQCTAVVYLRLLSLADIQTFVTKKFAFF